MNRKKDEPFDPAFKSIPPSKDLLFTLADQSHVESVACLMVHRNPDADAESLREKTQKEICELSNGKEYGVFVCVLSQQVVGFCRYYLSSLVPKEKIKFSSPEGFYCMGIMVSPEFRGQGIAHFMTQKRFAWLQGLGASEAYSMVDLTNLTSLKMHKSFGFEEISRAAGFLNVSFENSAGVLFRKKL